MRRWTVGVTGTVALIQLAEYVMNRVEASACALPERARTCRVSLGAAKHLCLADLAARRRGDIDSIELLWSGDVGQGGRHDVSHSGDDIFCLVYVRSDATWVYVIESTGGLNTFVEGDPLSKHTVYRLFGLGLDYERAPDSPHHLLGHADE